MKFESRDFTKLRWHLAAFATLAALSGLLAVGSRFLEQSALAERETAAARQRQTESRLRQVRTEEQEIKDKSALFLQLMATGVIGEEKRLDWTELLADLQQRVRLPGMSYEFAPQAPLDGNGTGDYAFYSSPMKLHLDLVHEGDLLDFLAGLRNGAKAMVLIRGCNLVRAPGEQRGLTADCDLEWVTVRGKVPTP